VAFAGPASNLVTAAAVAVPLRFIEGDVDRLLTVLETPLLDLAYSVLLLLLVVNVVLFLFNLLPLPPLDGWSVAKGIVPASMAYRMREVEVQYANILPILFLGFVVILFVSGGSLLGSLIDTLVGLLLGR
jgi:Zn-dependent protease